MKYVTMFIVLLASVLFASTQFAKNPPMKNTEIHLHIEGLSSSWIYLQGVYKNVKSKLDSTWLDAEGNALFKYDISLDPGYYTVELPEEASLPMLLDRDQTFSLETSTNQLIQHMQVSGSTENTLLYTTLQFDIDLGNRFQAEIREIQEKGEQPLDQASINQLRQEYLGEKDAYINGLFRKHPNTLFAKFEKAKQAPGILNSILTDPSVDRATRQEMMLNHFWDNVDFQDERLLRTPVIFDKLWQYLNDYVPNQTDIKVQAVDLLMDKVTGYPAYYQFFAQWIAEEYMPPYTGQMDPDVLYVHMVNHYLTEERAYWADSTQLYAWQLRAEGRSVNLVGMKGGNFEAKDPTGQSRSLYDVKAPYIALFFYHAECDHCIEETPKLVQQYRALKDQGLEVFAVAMNTPDEEWKDFIQKNEMNWINVTDEDNAAIYDHYFVQATPEIILLNPDRTIIGKHLASEDLPLVMQMDREGMFNRTAISSTTK